MKSPSHQQAPPRAFRSSRPMLIGFWVNPVGSRARSPLRESAVLFNVARRVSSAKPVSGQLPDSRPHVQNHLVRCALTNGEKLGCAMWDSPVNYTASSEARTCVEPRSLRRAAGGRCGAPNFGILHRSGGRRTGGEPARSYCAERNKALLVKDSSSTRPFHVAVCAAVENEVEFRRP